MPLPVHRPNERWSMDFISDRLANGHRSRALTLVDNFSRVRPAIEVDRSLTGHRVVAVLERLKVTHGPGTPWVKRIAVDNGPEFVSKALDGWAHRNGGQ